MRTHYDPARPREPERTAQRQHYEPSAARDRDQDDRDGYGEFPGQIGDDYDDAERRFGNHRNDAGAQRRAPERDRRQQAEVESRETTPRASAQKDATHGFRGRGPRGYVRSDERIREEICERLTDEDVDVSDVEVHVSKGVATLTGTVRDRRTKREIESVVDGVSGVTDVSNQLRLEKSAETESKDPLSSLGPERKPDDADTRMP